MALILQSVKNNDLGCDIMFVQEDLPCLSMVLRI